IQRLETEFDRYVFESQFVSMTFDKPDLIAEDISQYVDLCITFVDEPYLLRLIKKLDQKLSDLAEDTDKGMSKSLADTIKVKTDELETLRKRRFTLINNLNKKRSDRIKEQTEANRSFSNIVQQFMKEESRLKMVEMAERQRQLLE